MAKLTQSQWLKLKDMEQRLLRGPSGAFPPPGPAREHFQPYRTVAEANASWRLWLDTWVVSTLQEVLRSSQPDSIVSRAKEQDR